MTSPVWISASAAGLPGSTLVTRLRFMFQAEVLGYFRSEFLHGNPQGFSRRQLRRFRFLLHLAHLYGAFHLFPVSYYLDVHHLADRSRCNDPGKVFRLCNIFAVKLTMTSLARVLPFRRPTFEYIRNKNSHFVFSGRKIFEGWSHLLNSNSQPSSGDRSFLFQLGIMLWPYRSGSQIQSPARSD